MGHNVMTVWYKMSNCFHICNELLEQSVPYVVLNGYDTNMYHIMIGICHISGTENYFWLCRIKTGVRRSTTQSAHSCKVCVLTSVICTLWSEMYFLHLVECIGMLTPRPLYQYIYR